MSFFLNVTEQNWNKSGKLAEQQKSQRAITIKNKFLEQTRDKKLVGNFEPIIKKK